MNNYIIQDVDKFIEEMSMVLTKAFYENAPDIKFREMSRILERMKSYYTDKLK